MKVDYAIPAEREARRMKDLARASALLVAVVFANGCATIPPTRLIPLPISAPEPVANRDSLRMLQGVSADYSMLAANFPLAFVTSGDRDTLWLSPKDHKFPSAAALRLAYPVVEAGDPIFITLRRVYVADTDAWFNEADIAVLLRLDTGEGTDVDKKWILAAYIPAVQDDSFVNKENITVWSGNVPASLTLDVRVVSMLQEDKRKVDQILQVAGEVSNFIPTYGPAARALVDAGRKINDSLPDQAILLDYTLGFSPGDDERLRYAPYCILEQESLDDYRDQLWFDSAENEVKCVHEPWTLWSRKAEPAAGNEPQKQPSPPDESLDPAAEAARSPQRDQMQRIEVDVSSSRLQENWAVLVVEKGISNTFPVLQGERAEDLLQQARAVLGKKTTLSNEAFEAILKRSNSAVALSSVMSRAKWDSLGSIRMAFKVPGLEQSLVPEDANRLLATLRSFFPGQDLPETLDGAGLKTIQAVIGKDYTFDSHLKIFKLPQK